MAPRIVGVAAVTTMGMIMQAAIKIAWRGFCFTQSTYCLNLATSSRIAAVAFINAASLRLVAFGSVCDEKVIFLESTQ
jgi:hypothetical protein